MSTKYIVDMAIKIGGGPSAVGRAIGVSDVAIHHWRKSGRVPATRVLALEKITGGMVTRNQLRPDIFGALPAAENEDAE